MRLLKYLLAALLALASPASAAGWLPLSEPSAIPISNACTTSSGTTITFTTQGVGGANPNRITVVTINWDDSTNAGTAQLTAMSVGGISMTRAVSALSGVQNSNSEIWYAANPSGTTANIVATFATAVNGVTIDVYSLVGYVTDPVASNTGTTSVSQGYNNKQLALAAASRQVNVSTSLSNMTNDFSSACGANLWGVHASQRLSGNSQTLTSTISPTSNTPLIALAIWSTSPAPSCAEATAFLARTSGLTVAYTNGYQSLICGLVADGIWAKFDILYIFATKDTATAQLNLVSSSFPAVPTGSPLPAFVADRGYTGTSGPEAYISTGFVASSASSPQFVQNSAHISQWQLNNLVNPNGKFAAGMTIGASQQTGLHARFSDNNAYFYANSTGDTSFGSTNSAGHFLANRSGASALQGYINGTQVVTSANASGTVPNIEAIFIGQNVSGAIQGSAYQVAMGSLGSSLSSTDEANFYGRLRTWMSARGIP